MLSELPSYVSFNKLPLILQFFKRTYVNHNLLVTLNDVQRWIKWKLEYAHKIPERTDRNSLIVPTISTKVSNVVSRYCNQSLLSNKQIIAHIKMVSVLQLYSMGEVDIWSNSTSNQGCFGKTAFRCIAPSPIWPPSDFYLPGPLKQSGGSWW